MVTVALIKGNNRQQNIKDVLDLLDSELRKIIQNKNKIVIKPNLTSGKIPLASVQVEAVKTVLDTLLKYTKNKFIIAEGAGDVETPEAFRNFGYYDLKNQYNVDFKDLNYDNFIEAEILDNDSKLVKIRVAKTIFDSDFRISIALLKTHENLGVTLSTKNIVVGSLLRDKTRDERSIFHKNINMMSYNLARLVEVISPHLSIIDGFEGMEGEGPLRGNPVLVGVALAGFDFVAIDTVACILMGVDPQKIPYLRYCVDKKLGEGDISKIKIIGNTTISGTKKKFKLPQKFIEV